MSWLNLLRLRKTQSFQIIALSFILGCILWMMPVWAKVNPTAAVTLDGRDLFRVSQLEGVEAQQRADYANRILNRVVQSDKPAQVKLVDVNQLPAIQVNGANLVTVTDKDVPAGISKAQQAQRWRDVTEEAIVRAQNERRPGYFRQAALISVGCVLVAIALSWIVGWLWKNWLYALIPTPETIRESAAQPKTRLLLRFILEIVRVGIWLSILLYIANLFPQTRFWGQRIGEIVAYTLAEPILSLGDNSYSVIQILILIALFFGLLSLTKVLRDLLRSRILLFTGMNRGDQETIATIANYTLTFIGTLLLLQLWGLDLSSLTILAGVVGVGIGLGLQGIAKEFVSGLVIIFERPIQVGDFVNVGDFMGTVERISVRSTEIRTIDRVSIIVPNSRFLEKEVVNWSHGSPVTVLKLPIRIAYSSDLNKVRSALIDATKDHPDVVSEPPVNVLFKGYGENYLDLDLVVWIAEPRKQFLVRSDLYFRIDAIFRDRNIEIPYPRQELNLRSSNLPVELSPQLEASLSRLLKNNDNGTKRDGQNS